MKARHNTYGVDSDWARIRAASGHSSHDYAVSVGDAATVLRRFPPSSVHTCLTSPPYWSVRDYSDERQIGLEENLDDYVKNLVEVFAEVRRLLVPSGTVWLNLGDKYLSGVGTVKGKPPEKGWRRNKQLSLVPFRVAIALQEDGWWVRNALVWQKPNGLPISADDRLANQWEPIFLLTKSERYYFDVNAIRVPHKTDDEVERRRAESGRALGKASDKSELRKWLNSPRHRATIDGLKEVARRPNAPEAVKLAAYLLVSAEKRGLSVREVAKNLGQPYERVRHYFRTDQIGSRMPPDETWKQLKALLKLDGTYDEAMAVQYGDNVFRNHPKGRNPGDVQSFAVAFSEGQHFATMPLRLAEWALKPVLPAGGVCLDPFMGHGTTGIAAMAQGGKFVGVDLNSDYASSFIRSVASSRPREAAE